MSRATWLLGLEDGNEENVDVAQLEVPTETVEAELVEVQGLDQDIAVLNADGDQLASDTESLEATADVVADAAEDGGMDETAARAVDVAVESFTKRWGIRYNKVGNESFASSGSRVQATKVALESIKDAISSAWNTFIEWLQELINKLRDYWVKYVNAGKAMQKRADKLSDRLDNMGSKKKKEEVGGSWVSKLNLDGVISPDGVIALATAAKTNVKTVATNATVVLELATDGVRKAGSGGSKKSAATQPVEFGKKTTKKLDKAVPAQATDVKANAIPGGGYYVTFNILAGETSTNSAVYVSPAGDTADKKVPTPDASKMKAAIKAINDFGGALEETIKEFRKPQDELKTLKDNLKSAQEKLSDAKSETKDVARSALKVAQHKVKEFTAGQTAISALLKNGGFGLIGYVEAGIGAYEKA